MEQDFGPMRFHHRRGYLVRHHRNRTDRLSLFTAE